MGVESKISTTKTCTKQVKDYKEAKIDRKEAARKVVMSFSDFSKEAAKDTKAKTKETPKAPEKKAPTAEPKKKSWNPFSKKKVRIVLLVEIIGSML